MCRGQRAGRRRGGDVGRSLGPATAVLLAVLGAGCGEGCGAPSAPAVTPASPRSATLAEGRAGEEGSEAEGAPPDPGPPPVLKVAADVDRDGRVALRVENRGAALATLQTALVLEEQAAEGWTARDDVRLALLDRCGESPVPPCRRLAPGGVWLPPPWLGTVGASQCACEGCAPVDGGTYRVVVLSCGGAHRLEGEPVEVRGAASGSGP
ncbi:MAG: hypothetical protein ACFCGT_24210 [Sandaracinaceae bacterium]